MDQVNSELSKTTAIEKPLGDSTPPQSPDRQKSVEESGENPDPEHKVASKIVCAKETLDTSAWDLPEWRLPSNLSKSTVPSWQSEDHAENAHRLSPQKVDEKNSHEKNSQKNNRSKKVRDDPNDLAQFGASSEPRSENSENGDHQETEDRIPEEGSPDCGTSGGTLNLARGTRQTNTSRMTASVPSFAPSEPLGNFESHKPRIDPTQQSDTRITNTNNRITIQDRDVDSKLATAYDHTHRTTLIHHPTQDSHTHSHDTHTYQQHQHESRQHENHQRESHQRASRQDILIKSNGLQIRLDQKSNTDLHEENLILKSRIKRLEAENARLGHQVIDLKKNGDLCKEQWLKENLRATNLTAVVAEKDELIRQMIFTEQHHEAEIRRLTKQNASFYAFTNRFASKAPNSCSVLTGTIGRGTNSSSLHDETESVDLDAGRVRVSKSTHSRYKCESRFSCLPQHRHSTESGQGNNEVQQQAIVSTTSPDFRSDRSLQDSSKRSNRDGVSEAAQKATVGSLAVPLSVAAQRHGLSENLRRCMRKKSGLIFKEKGVVEIGFEVDEQNTIFTLFVGNLSVGSLEDLRVAFAHQQTDASSPAVPASPVIRNRHPRGGQDSVPLTAGSDVAVSWWIQPAMSTIRTHEQAAITFIAHVRRAFKLMPRVTLNFLLPDATPYTIQTWLPFNTCRFVHPVRGLSKADFLSIWQNQLFLVSQIAHTIYLNHALVDNFSLLVQRITLHSALEIYLGFDCDPSIVVLAGVFCPNTPGTSTQNSNQNCTQNINQKSWTQNPIVSHHVNNHGGRGVGGQSVIGQSVGEDWRGERRSSLMSEDENEGNIAVTPVGMMRHSHRRVCERINNNNGDGGNAGGNTEGSDTGVNRINDWKENLVVLKFRLPQNNTQHAGLQIRAECPALAKAVANDLIQNLTIFS